MAIIEIKVKPNSNKRKIKVKDNSIIVYLTSPPQNNKANNELINFLSKLFNSNIKIVSGKTSRRKKILIEGLSERGVLEIIKMKNLD